MKESFVYILVSQPYGTLYIGCTSNLIKRIWEHKNNVIDGFTRTYQVHRLVYYEIHSNIMEAAKRERRLKNWCRKWKLNLINKFNPRWQDLYEDICS